MRRGYLLFRTENPAERGKEWAHKVWTYDYFHPKPLRRFCAAGHWKIVKEGEPL